MTRPDRDPELDALARELSDVLRELRGELRRSRGPLGVFLPPSPREVFSFTERRAIPAAITVLEVNIRALEVLAAAVRLVERPPGSDRSPAGERSHGGRRSAESRSWRRRGAAGRATLERLDAALVDLKDALEGEPASPEARRLVEQARELRDEVDERLREVTAPSSTGVGGYSRSARPRSVSPRGATGREGTDRESHEIPVDVESELDAIKRDLDDEE